MTPSQEFYSRLSRAFGEARKALGRDVGAFVEELGMSRERYRRIVWGMVRPTTAELDALARVTRTNIDLIVSGSVDFNVMGRHAHADFQAVPERYADPKQKMARTRGIQVIHDYLLLNCGATYAREMLDRFQLHPKLFADPLAFVSPQIFEDLLAEIRHEGFCDEMIRDVGTMTLNVTRPYFQGWTAGRQAPKAVYAHVHEELFQKHYDRVSRYDLLRLTDDGCIATITTREEAMDAFKSRNVGTRNLCLYRQGVYMSFLGHVLPRYAKIEETECMYEGAKRCTLHASWN